MRGAEQVGSIPTVEVGTGGGPVAEEDGAAGGEEVGGGGGGLGATHVAEGHRRREGLLPICRGARARGRQGEEGRRRRGGQPTRRGMLRG